MRSSNSTVASDMEELNASNIVKLIERRSPSANVLLSKFKSPILI